MESTNDSFYKKYVKVFLDFIISIVSLTVFSPILLIIAIAIKLDSKGPVFFKQKRLGLYGHNFYIYKFRTMIVNAEKIGDGLSIKNENDNRITKVGKFLRKTSLDELPQLINLLKKEMSLIGPRPPVVYHPYKGYENYPDWTKGRFEVRPGITGLAQIKVRNSATWEERIKYDNDYVENISFTNDVKIFFNTFKTILSRDKIY
ncbi:sugar transferase [uncultured Anaerococcus sp.]|uniref:sugar transferase n=1 Tax=uncultured Anaerococcus sp. TaxID=293428 RepID=UPI0025FA34D8|nr:sugar transferase [uncultured Anaerococcus sp.]